MYHKSKQKIFEQTFLTRVLLTCLKTLKPLIAVMDFSTNRHSDVLQDVQPPSRHPGLSFDDGNIALLTGSVYFVVHQGVLARHSEILKKAIEALKSTQVHLLEDLPVLSVQESPQDMFQFLLALYDGMCVLLVEYSQIFPMQTEYAALL